MNDNAELTLVNVLSLIEFRDCSIPNSISIPYETHSKNRKICPKIKIPLLIFLLLFRALPVESEKPRKSLSKSWDTPMSMFLNGGLPAWKLKGYPTVSPRASGTNEYFKLEAEGAQRMHPEE